jgi:stearoyl-CoA desaturase (delta-9 desaturase)
VNTARDNGILALFTFGEGYHNYHHIFEYDYRNGIRWWQYDPTKWLVKSLSWIGLTKNLRTVPEDRIQQAKFSMQLLKAKHKIAHVPNAEVIMQKLESEYHELVDKCNAYYASRKRLMRIQQRQLQKTVDKIDLQHTCDELKQAFMEQKQRWQFVRLQLLQPA